MGTTYNIKIVPVKNKLSLKNLQSSIDSIFNVIDIQMSLYNPESEIVKFNKSNDSLQISKEFENVLLASKYFNEITKGGF